MTNAILLIILVFGILSFIYAILYRLTTKNLTEMKKFIESNGYNTKAEVMGHILIHSGRATGKCPVLKFNDNFNNEQIVVKVDGSYGFFKYNKGDIVNIKYIETEEFPDHLKNIIMSEFLERTCNAGKHKMCNEYFEKPYEDIVLTNNSKKYRILIKDKPTRQYKIQWLLAFSPAIFAAILFAIMIAIS